jgi:putative FmdB family regulatory protein
MPTYEYECPKCGHRFEKFQEISDPPVKTCPKCRGRRVKRLIGTGVGIIFKGGGFHQTDYRSDSYKRQAKKEASGGKDAGSGKADAAKKKDGPAKPASGKKGGD